MKLQTIKQISGKIRVMTGLHIGAGKGSLEIGGLDQPVIKHPISSAPYIPGSSIKGKMRSLLETTHFVERPATRKFVVQDGKPCGCAAADCPACAIFGTSAANKTPELGPTRLIVRDAYLTEAWDQKFRSGDLPMEVKYENTIHRVQGTAENPRPLERVPAGVEFTFNLSFKVFEGDDPKWLDYVYQGLKLVQLDALGGCSSRGSGQVAFVGLTCDGQAVDIDALSI